MRDSILELWLRLLAPLHIEDPDEASIAQTIRDKWLLASRGYFVGHVPAQLEEAVSTSEGKAIVLAAIHSLMQAFANGPELLDRGTVNLLGFQDVNFTGALESKRFLEVGNAFIALIAGQIQTGATSTEFMPDSNVAT